MKTEEIQIGTSVRYWGVIAQNGQKYDPFDTTIRSEAWNLESGETVCLITGKSGAVSIKHLEPISELNKPTP